MSAPSLPWVPCGATIAGMEAIRVRYSVKREFVATNQENIAAVMAELRARGDVGVKYASFLEPDGQTFVHLVVARDEPTMAIVPTLDAFKAFQAALRPNLEVPPQSERWQVVGSSFDP
jgi:putative heme iron utilization protein